MPSTRSAISEMADPNRSGRRYFVVLRVNPPARRPLGVVDVVEETMRWAAAECAAWERSTTASGPLSAITNFM